MGLLWKKLLITPRWNVFKQSMMLKKIEVCGGTLSYQGIYVLNDIEASSYVGSNKKIRNRLLCFCVHLHAWSVWQSSLSTQQTLFVHISEYHSIWWGNHIWIYKSHKISDSYLWTWTCCQPTSWECQCIHWCSLSYKKFVSCICRLKNVWCLSLGTNKEYEIFYSWWDQPIWFSATQQHLCNENNSIILWYIPVFSSSWTFTKIMTILQA